VLPWQRGPCPPQTGKRQQKNFNDGRPEAENPSFFCAPQERGIDSAEGEPIGTGGHVSFSIMTIQHSPVPLLGTYLSGERKPPTGQHQASEGALATLTPPLGTYSFMNAGFGGTGMLVE